MSYELQFNNIGTELRVIIVDCNDNPINIASATSKSIILKKPGGTLTIYDASFLTDGTDGVILYNTVDGDLDEIGSWKIQAAITTPSGSWRTNFKTFKVYRNI